jgi:hypothetical protein
MNGEEILAKTKAALQGEKKNTYLFSASTTAKEKEIAQLETLADHLIMTRSEKAPFRLYMQLARIESAPFPDEEIKVPIMEDVLMGTREIADHSRVMVTPLISKL